MLALNRRLQFEDLLERASRASGLDDFGDWPFAEGLRVLLRALGDEADLSLFGYWGTRWDLCRFLSNLLRLRHEELLSPEILEQPIEGPLFITGLPRSGTTFLHRLLSMDDNNRVPRVWETIHPYPPPGRRDRRQEQVQRQLRMFRLLAPGFHQMHPIGAASPQECSEISAHIFASLRFDSTYSVPSYRQWLDQTGHLAAYRFHKRFLQHLQHQATRRARWVLKCPDHVFALPEIREVYPDARFIFVHRDPAEVMPSLIRLTEILRRPFTRLVNPEELAHREFERWSAGAALMVRATEQEEFRQRIFHIRYRDLIREPLAAIRALYSHFGLNLEIEAARRINRLLNSEDRGGYGPKRSNSGGPEIDPAALQERFALYSARMGFATAPWASHTPSRRLG